MPEPYSPSLTYTPSPPQEESPADEIENLFGQKRQTIQTKLEVLASEIFERMRIRTLNLSRLQENRIDLYKMLSQLDRQANYHLRDHAEKRVFYELLFKVKQEERQEDVECWRDIVMVMRDFLPVWEVREQVRARAIFLDHAGP
jgi:hypothetical protein